MCTLSAKAKAFIFCNLLIFSYLPSFAITFSFELTSPINKVDSLETWLKNNPKVTPDRLINLVKVERSYAWVNKYRSGRYLPELMKLDSVGYGSTFKASVFYVQAVHHYLQNQHAQAFKSITVSYDLFEQMNNSGGVFYASCLLLQLRFDKSGDNLLIGSNLEHTYLVNVRQIIKKEKDLDALIQAKKSLFIYDNSINPDRDGKTMEKEAKSIMRFIDQYPRIAYARCTINMYVSLAYHYQGRDLDSYNSNKAGLLALKEDQLEEHIFFLYNLSVDCIRLNKLEEGLRYSEETLALLYASKSKDYSMFEGLYANLMYIADKLGNSNKLLPYADSTLNYMKAEIQQKQANMLLEMEQKYENEKKKQKIIELEAQKRRYLSGFLIIGLFVATIIFLGYRIVKTNQSLRKLVSLRDDFIRTIAHDLRRPMHAFVGLSEVFAKLLRKGDTDSIHKIAQSIDTSGLAVRQTLDNLLYWALAQKESLVVQPSTFCIAAHIQSVASLFTGVMALNKQELQILCPDQWEVCADPNALSLILRNLVDNATKHTSAGGIVRLEVNTMQEGTFLYVEDTGKGMDQGQVESIRSILANPNQMRPHQQTHGLGLILVGLFAQKAKIGIQLESSLGAGTKYTVGPLPSAK